MQYGYFDDKTLEYVITRPDTPAPWANYLGSPEYGALISNNAGGYSFVKSGAEGRILRYVFNQFDSISSISRADIFTYATIRMAISGRLRGSRSARIWVSIKVSAGTGPAIPPCAAGTAASVQRRRIMCRSAVPMRCGASG